MTKNRHHVYPPILARARELHQPQTPAETQLWAHLRNRQLGGFKFRRQHPIDRFIVDFYCAACPLAVEIDGDSHAEQVKTTLRVRKGSMNRAITSSVSRIGTFFIAPMRYWRRSWKHVRD